MAAFILELVYPGLAAERGFLPKRAIEVEIEESWSMSVEIE